MHNLITGGGGFLGSQLCAYLLTQGQQVTVVDNFSTSNHSTTDHLLNNPNFVRIEADITNPIDQKLKKSIDRIYHLACPTGVANCGPLAKEMLTTSVLGTYRVIELAKKYQAAVLFTSSSEVYGTPLEFPQAESYWGNVDPIGFRSPYEEGKRVAEALLLEAGKRFNLDIKIARLFNAYGPGMLPRDSRVIPQFISAALAQKPIKITGEGKQQRTFMYVTDTIAALTVLMEKAPSGSIINVGSEVETAIVDIARKIKSLTQSHSELIFVSRPSHDPSRRVPEITKLKRLGFIPQIDLAAGLAKTIAYFKKYLEEKSALN